MPQVRLSVPGPKMTGEAHKSFCSIYKKSMAGQGKAIETNHFRPTYAEANVGHPSCSYWVLLGADACPSHLTLYAKPEPD
jgi:hypothetical protein